MKIYKYTQVAGYQAALSLRLQSLDEFSRFLDQYQYRQVLVLPPTEGTPAQFAVIHSGALVTRDTEGYHLLEDYHAAAKGGFPSAKTYYESKIIGCADYACYEAAMQSGTDDLERIARLREAGFIEGFPAFESLRKKSAVAAGITAGTAAALYNWAVTAGFASFAEIKEALLRGFTEAAVYKVAVEKQYDNAADFLKGSEGGFLNAAEWKDAQRVGARDRDDLARFQELELLNLPMLAHDEKCVLVLLSKLPQHKKVSANKFTALLKQAIDSYRHAGELPAWFRTAFPDDASCIAFLQRSEEARRYGTYDKDGEYFETRKLQERKVVLDGSNVAYSLRQGPEKRPALANILRTVEALKERGFSEIIVMSDASLAHRISDGDLLPALEKLVTYIQTPAAKAADVFLLEYVKTNRCLLLSNDTFREWKLKDAWVAANIDYYRLSFVLSDDALLLPDLDDEKTSPVTKAA